MTDRQGDTTDPAQDSAARFLFPVVNLDLPDDVIWPMGHAAIRSAAWLRQRYGESQEKFAERPWAVALQRGSEEDMHGKWAVIDVPGPSEEKALSTAREALAVLRSFQHARCNWGADLQVIGLAADVTSGRSIGYLMIDGDVRGLQHRMIGAFASWKPTPEDVGALITDPVFVHLSEILRSPSNARPELRGRFVVGLGVLYQATVLVGAAVRVALATAALEAVFGDPPAPKEDGFRPQAYPVALRVAHVACEVAQKQSRPCRVHRPGTAGAPTDCIVYQQVKSVFEERNSILHGGLNPASGLHALEVVYLVEGWIRCAIEWSLRSDEHLTVSALDRVAGVPPFIAKRRAKRSATRNRTGAPTGH